MGKPVKSELITFVASPQMSELLTRLADRCHVSKSQLIRTLIREQADREKLDYAEAIKYETT